MDSISPTIWFPVVTLITGALLKALFDALSENRRLAADREARLERRREVILLQRIEQQRKYLEALQEIAADLARTTGQLHLHDVRAYRQGEAWGKTEADPGLAEQSRICHRQMNIYYVRVQSAAVREKALELSVHASSISSAASEEESHHQVNLMGQSFSQLNALIGETLRKLESDEQALFS